MSWNALSEKLVKTNWFTAQIQLLIEIEKKSWVQIMSNNKKSLIEFIFIMPSKMEMTLKQFMNSFKNEKICPLLEHILIARFALGINVNYIFSKLLNLFLISNEKEISIYLLSKSEWVKFLIIESVICLFTDSSVQKYFSLSNQLIFTDWINEKNIFHL